MDDDEREFHKAVLEGLVPKVEGSNFCVAICPQSEESMIDPKFCTELGVMIQLDKPIIAIVGPGGTISKKLELVADKIVHADIATDAGQALLMEAITDMQDQFKA